MTKVTFEFRCSKNTPIRAVVPEVPQAGDKVTVRNVTTGAVEDWDVLRRDFNLVTDDAGSPVEGSMRVVLHKNTVDLR